MLTGGEGSKACRCYSSLPKTKTNNTQTTNRANVIATNRVSPIVSAVFHLWKPHVRGTFVRMSFISDTPKRNGGGYVCLSQHPSPPNARPEDGLTRIPWIISRKSPYRWPQRLWPQRTRCFIFSLTHAPFFSLSCSLSLSLSCPRGMVVRSFRWSFYHFFGWLCRWVRTCIYIHASTLRNGGATLQQTVLSARGKLLVRLNSWKNNITLRSVEGLGAVSVTDDRVCVSRSNQCSTSHPCPTTKLRPCSYRLLLQYVLCATSQI